jgi:V/A-type H+-transporting ATPase subunit I
MIVEMKKLTLLLYHREKEQFLQRLQELGVVHVEENPEASSEALREVQEKIRAAERVRQSLKRLEAAKKLSVEPASDKDADTVVARYNELEAGVENLENQIQVQRKNIDVLEPWGNFDPAGIERLRESGVRIRFFVTTPKRFAAMEKPNATLEEINRRGSSVCFVVFERGEKGEIDAEEVVLPAISLSTARERRKELESKKIEAERKLDELTRYRGVLDTFLGEQQCGRDLESARLSMGEQVEGRVLSFTGWLPASKEEKVRAFLDQFPAWYRTDDAGPEDRVPVELVNKKSINLFEPIVNIYSLPDYFELDPTPFIAPFFAFFFGLCLGDVGYGLLLAGLSVVGLAKGPAGLRRFMQLGIILGIMTAIGGVFLNTFFGHPIFEVPGYGNALMSGGRAAALLAPVETETGTYFPAMPFSVYIGVLQILVGIALKGINRVRNNGPAWGIQPVSHALMVVGVVSYLAGLDFMDLKKLELGGFALGTMVASVPLSVVGVLIGGGLVLHMLFNNPNKGLPIRFGLGLWELYQFASGLMSDGLSYLRLFALGLAGGLLGAAFNQIAFMFITTEAGDINYASVGMIGTIFVLIVGHTLNFVLAALGAFVHPLRLTFVEFYNNLEFKGGGVPYRPLSKEIRA